MRDSSSRREDVKVPVNTTRLLVVSVCHGKENYCTLEANITAIFRSTSSCILMILIIIYVGKETYCNLEANIAILRSTFSCILMIFLII